MSEAAALRLLTTQQPQKRARAQLSCTLCRAGKLKCNRIHPACDQCIKRNREAHCQYVAAPPKKKPNQSMKERIKHLESMVIDMYTANNPRGSSSESPQCASTESSNSQDDSPRTGDDSTGTRRRLPPFVIESDDNNAAFGRLKIGKTDSKYVGTSHWEAILDNIAEVRECLDEPEEESEESLASLPTSDSNALTPTSQSLLYPNSSIKMNRQDLVEALPSRSRADALVASYFNSEDPALGIMHTATFKKEYALFWQNPDSASLVWIAHLFGLLALGAKMHSTGGEWPATPQNAADKKESDKYSSLAASALILSNYTKPVAGTVEALLVYAEGKYMNDDDDHMDAWLLMCIAIRLALRMGYHRDPEHTKLCAFYGEMRRRSWWMVVQFDTLLSFEIGLPGMTFSVQSDTKFPHNFMDSDFSPETKFLPLPRPETELTPVSYMRHKSQLCKVFGRVAELSHMISPAPCAEVFELDQQLNTVISALPPVLRVLPLEESITDRPGLIMMRFNLDLLANKTRCLIHRRFLTETVVGEVVEHSRNVCVEAAMNLLRRHAAIDAAVDAGMIHQGFLTNSFHTHDFLLGAMIISLELDKKMRNIPEGGYNEEEKKSLAEMRSLLESSYRTWQKPKFPTPTTQKASKVVLIMLSRVAKSAQEASPMTAQTPEAQMPTPQFNMENSPQQGAREVLHGSQQTVESPLVLTDLDHQPLDLNNGDQFKEHFAAIGNLFDMQYGMDHLMDWQSWDTYIFGQNVEASMTAPGQYDNGFYNPQLEPSPQ